MHVHLFYTPFLQRLPDMQGQEKSYWILSHIWRSRKETHFILFSINLLRFILSLTVKILDVLLQGTIALGGVGD